MVLNLTVIVSTQPQDGWATLDTSRYTINYPVEWELEVDGELGTRFFLFSPLESEEDQFSENINLITEDLTGLGIDLDMYNDLASGQLETVIEEYSLIESQRVTWNDQSYHKLVYTGTLDALALAFEQRFYVEHETAFILTFASMQDTFDQYAEVRDRIMSSFLIK